MSKQSGKDRLNFLKEEISSLKKRLDFYMIDQENNLKEMKNTFDKTKDSIDKDFDEFHENVREAKKEIVTFTTELISIIIGFLALVIAVVVLGVNKDGINNEMLPIYVAIATAFIVLFMFFVGSWIFKNFPKVEGTSYRKIISYIDNRIKSNNLDLGEYIKSNTLNMDKDIDGKILKCCEYIDEKISEVAKLIRGGKK